MTHLIFFPEMCLEGFFLSYMWLYDTPFFWQHRWNYCIHNRQENIFRKYKIFVPLFFLFFIFLNLFLEKGEGRKRGRETSMCGCRLHTLQWGPGLQPMHVPWLGIEPVTVWFTGQHSVHWATPARANLCSFIKIKLTTEVKKNTFLGQEVYF